MQYFQAASQENSKWKTIKLVSYKQNIRDLSTNRNTRSILFLYSAKSRSMRAVMEVYFYANISPVNFISRNKIVSALKHSVSSWTGNYMHIFHFAFLKTTKKYCSGVICST